LNIRRDYTKDEMLNGLLNRDEKAVKKFYVYYFKSICNMVTSNNGTTDDAKDIFQDALLILFQQLRKIDFQLDCSPGTYLYSVSKLLWLKELKRRNLNPSLPINEDNLICSDTALEEMADYNKRLLIYRREFEQLSENCKKVIKLFLEGTSIRKITEIMGYKSIQHTKNRRYRCKQALIKRIKNSQLKNRNNESITNN